MRGVCHKNACTRASDTPCTDMSLRYADLFFVSMTSPAMNMADVACGSVRAASQSNVIATERDVDGPTVEIVHGRGKLSLVSRLESRGSDALDIVVSVQETCLVMIPRSP